jgi:hypothetical protein
VELAKQETDPFWRTYALAQAYFAHGERVEADAELQKMIETDADGAGSQIAEAYALRKEPDNCLSGWTAAGAREIPASRNCFSIPSCAPTRTTRGSSPSHKKSA